MGVGGPRVGGGREGGRRQGGERGEGVGGEGAGGVGRGGAGMGRGDFLHRAPGQWGVGHGWGAAMGEKTLRAGSV